MDNVDDPDQQVEGWSAVSVAFPHGNVTVNLDGVGRAGQSVQDGIRDCRASEILVPALGAELRAHDGRGMVDAALHDLEQALLLFLRSLVQEELVKDEHGRLLAFAQELFALAVEVCRAVAGEKVWQAHIEHLEIVVAGVDAERVGDVGLARAGRSDNDHVAMALDVAVRAEAVDELLVQVTVWQVFDASEACIRIEQVRVLQQAGQMVVVAVVVLMVNQHGEAVVESQIGEAVDLFHLLFIGIRHRGKPDFTQLAEGVISHGSALRSKRRHEGMHDFSAAAASHAP